VLIAVAIGAVSASVQQKDAELNLRVWRHPLASIYASTLGSAAMLTLESRGRSSPYPWTITLGGPPYTQHRGLPPSRNLCAVERCLWLSQHPNSVHEIQAASGTRPFREPNQQTVRSDERFLGKVSVISTNFGLTTHSQNFRVMRATWVSYAFICHIKS
jgi:hypothetical protein